MKYPAALLLVMLLSFLSGCATKIESMVPAITAKSFSYTRTGKFSSTTVKASGLTSDANSVKADNVSIRHSNTWIPNIEIELQGYERTKTPAEAAAHAPIAK